MPTPPLTVVPPTIDTKVIVLPVILRSEQHREGMQPEQIALPRSPLLSEKLQVLGEGGRWGGIREGPPHTGDSMRPHMPSAERRLRSGWRRP